MIFSRAYFALLRRNLIYRQRNVFGTLFEIILPVGFICMLLAIKVTLEDSDSFQPETIPALFPNNNWAMLPLSFRDYVSSLQAPRFCIESNYNAEYWQYEISGYFGNQNPFLKCDRRSCEASGEDASPYCEIPILAIAPEAAGDTRGAARAEAFKSYIEAKYPEILTSIDIDYDFVQLFDSSDAISAHVAGAKYGTHDARKIGFAVVFADGTSEKDYAYTLRMNSTNFNQPEEEGRPAQSTTPDTEREFDSFATIDDACVPEDGTTYQGNWYASCTGQYAYNGALSIQRLVGDFVMEDTGSKGAGTFVAEHGVQFVSFPTKEYTINGFYASINPFAPLLICLGLLYPVAAMIRALTLEKQLRQKELLLMMSVRESDIGWSWFTSFGVFHLVTAFLTALAANSLYEQSGFVVLLIFWLLSFSAVIVFSFLISAIFTKATTATLVGLLVFFAGYFLTLVTNFETGNSGVISLLSLHPVTAIAYGMQEIGRLEDAGVGATAGTIGSSDSPSGFTLIQAMFSLAVDSVLWGLVFGYLKRVIPSQYGQALPWHFPFSFCCGGSGPASEGAAVAAKDNVPIEEVGEAMHAAINDGQGIEIRGLSKQFGDKTAVDNLSLAMYPNQVTALLGHNGAGKTTTISMLTGMLSPTAGSATLAGKNIRTNMGEIRQELGICLQHDCLFPQLTVKEHIAFFSRLKGLYSKYLVADVEEKIKQSLEDVALLEKRNTLSKNLSGGMKRKLSVAIAFCGESKTVLLDEPTSGMDPFSRRFTWNVIRNYRQDRTIILTTHFMDEADILGDRIAIMSEGTLRCAGSSLFLKKHYGVGYQLTIEKNARIGNSGGGVIAGKGAEEVVHDASEEQEISRASPDEEIHSDVPNFPLQEIENPVFVALDIDENLESIVKRSVPEANLLSNVGTEMSFQLPLGSSPNFTTMFQALDQEADANRIVTYGVSITTLDEVFLLVARGGSAEKVELRSSAARNGVFLDEDQKSARSRMDLDTSGLFMRHVNSLFVKRALNFKRDKKAWFCSTMLPTLLVTIGFLIFKFSADDSGPGALTLSMDSFNPSVSSEPRNPIPFNDPGSTFPCQPGRCIQAFQGVPELFTVCGSGFFSDTSLQCTISESTEFIAEITQFGAEGVPLENADITESSVNLAESAKLYDATQYGAIQFTHDRVSIVNEANYSSVVVTSCVDYVEANNLSYYQSSYCDDYAGVGYLVNYNYTSLHSSLIYQGIADQALMREALNDDEITISPTIHPLPLTSHEDGLLEAENAFLSWFLIVFSFPFIAGSFGTFVVTERSNKAKHLQTVAGVEPSAYWISSFLWDTMNYQLPLWITVILMFAFSVTSFTTSDRGVLGGSIVSLVFYGPAVAGFTYCVTFLFKSASMCNLFVIIFNFLIGLAGPLVTFILRLLGDPSALNNPKLINIANVVEWFLRFIPSFNLGNSLFKIINIQTLESLAEKPITVWDETAILYEVILQASGCIIYVVLAIQIDKWSTNPRIVSVWQAIAGLITCRCFGPLLFGISGGTAATSAGVELADDQDVLGENERIAAGEANSDLIVLDQLTKVYDNGKKAVNNLSLGIPPGQCFGLLGINGAGKTTTMAMLTAEFPPSTGDATLGGFSVTCQPEKTRRRVGYCPQFDAHFQNMTGREHVALYAAIKGVPADLVDTAAAEKLAEVGLSEADSNRLSSGYSGGMKRKLSVACATIGQPQMVFLDEPSTGMDPVARRDLWAVISDMVTGGNIPDDERTSVILTTHSMEECEALCPRIGIMATGKLRCLGSAQHLKTRFGQGYQVEMKIQNVDKEDADYREICCKLSGTSGSEAGVATEAFFNLAQTMTALRGLTNDDSLSFKVNPDDQTGFSIYKHANSPVGATLEELASFAASELRMQKLEKFFLDNFSEYALRERQDSKARYEVTSAGVKISNIFGKIESNKADLRLADYGVSQTSLEQVFNMHAAEAEKLKHGTTD